MLYSASIPRDPAFDGTLAPLPDGYKFGFNRRRQLDIFAARLMLRLVVCTSGEDAARMFHQSDRFTRRRALQPTRATAA